MTSPTEESNGPSARGSFEAGSSLVALWRTARKFWPTILVVTVASTLAVTFYTLGQTKIFSAKAVIQLDPNPPRPLGNKVEAVVDMGNGSYWNNREYYETQYKIMTSMRVALAVVRELDLVHDAAFQANVPTTPGKAKTESAEDVAEMLLARLKVEPVKESRLAVLYYEDADPARAQRILTKVVDTYVEENLEDAITSTGSAADWLRTQLDKLKNDLESNEMALHDYKMRNNILSVAFDDQSNMLREQMKQINTALTGVSTKREEIAARRAELRKVSPDEPTRMPATELLQSPLIQGLRQRYEESLRDRDSMLAAGKGKSHPDVLGASQRVENTKTALFSEVRNVQGAVDRDLAVISRQEAGLSTLLETAKKQALELNLMEIEYKRLERTKDNTAKLYNLVLERAKESDLTRMMRVNNIRVVDPSLLPRVPVRPRVPVNVALGLLGGFALGIVLALARDLLDRTVKTPADVENEIALAFLGLLPEMEEDEGKKPVKHGRGRRARIAAGANPELIVHDLPSSGIAEAARTIRTNLLFMSPDRPYRTILITSAGPSEGKTTVACCIAVAMAQAGQRVCIVDCDLRRPRLHRIFKRDNTVGLTSALLDPSFSLESLESQVPNLSVLPSGPIPPNPSELLHSNSFGRVLHQLTERFDRVIIDSPPVVAVTDAAILSTLVDGTIMVVRAFKTGKDICRQGIRSLQDVGGHIIGAVLNAVDLGRQEYGSYYYYYYRRDGGYAPLAVPHQVGVNEPAPPPAS